MRASRWSNDQLPPGKKIRWKSVNAGSNATAKKPPTRATPTASPAAPREIARHVQDWRPTRPTARAKTAAPARISTTSERARSCTSRRWAASEDPKNGTAVPAGPVTVWANAPDPKKSSVSVDQEMAWTSVAGSPRIAALPARSSAPSRYHGVATAIPARPMTTSAPEIATANEAMPRALVLSRSAGRSLARGSPVMDRAIVARVEGAAGSRAVSPPRACAPAPTTHRWSAGRAPRDRVARRPG